MIYPEGQKIKLDCIIYINIKEILIIQNKQHQFQQDNGKQ